MWSLLPLVIAGVVYYYMSLSPPEVRTVEVRVKRGETTADIADTLAGAGVVTNAYTFRAYAAMTQTEARLQPGKYTFRTNETYGRILKKLTHVKKRTYVKLIIPEGFTATQITERLADLTQCPTADFYEFIRGQGLAQVKPSELPSDVGTVEGYLFPKTYTFDKKEHPRKIVARLVRQFKTETLEIDWSFSRQKSLSVHQIMTIASLIETEARVPEERSLIAAVIYNRIDKGMPLQIDATVQYALPQRKEALSNTDLKIESPYNTYQHIGLPPGPIASPGLASIKAALEPADVDYIYYVLTSADGRHTFTNNYDEFLAAKRQMN